MADLIVKEPVNARQWNPVLMNNFADTLGVSLEELGKEYDDMIKTFELQKAQLRNYTPCEGAILEEKTFRAPSPTPSDSSQNSYKNGIKKRTFSAAGIQSSIRSARDTLRRKLSSSKSRSPSYQPALTRKANHSSISSLSHHSDTSSIDQENSAMKPRSA